MTIEVERGLPGLNFGCTVRNLTMDDIHDDAVRSQLWDLFIQDGMIVFRDTNVTLDLHVEVSRVFGELAIHPLSASLSPPGHPELIHLRHDPETETLFEVDGEVIGSFTPWHFDGVFVEKINRGGVLRIVDMPEQGGDTGFVDGIDAYDTLPEELKCRIEGLSVAYQLGFGYDFIPRNSIRIVREGKRVRDSRLRIEAGDFPVVIHPLVYSQAETGRKILKFSPTFAKYIPGLSDAESDALLNDVSYHVTDESRAYVHHWTTTDEMVLWDNWRMLHKAAGVPGHMHRLVSRTTIAGDYGLGRLADAQATAAGNAPEP